MLYMSLKKFLEKIDFKPGEKDMSYLKIKSEEICEKIKNTLKKRKIDADVFIGGSFAKGTMERKEEYDLDIFIRFDWEYQNLSDELEKILKFAFFKSGIQTKKSLHVTSGLLGAQDAKSTLRHLDIKKMHGSRDYFRINENKRFNFEIIPVTRIKNPKEARNVTDASYFHVNYVRRKMKTKKDIARQIRIAKSFFRASGGYGAESYIGGISGYGVECLIIYFKSFEKMAKWMINVKEREVIDMEKKYKKKRDVLFELNESKINCPIVLVDPTFKERNVLAALTKETFAKIQEKLKEFLRNPKEESFIEKKLDEKDILRTAEKKRAELLKVEIFTDKQEGDIAGSKLKKFSKFLEGEISRYFDVLSYNFNYNFGNSAKAYYILKSKKELLLVGPPKNIEKGAKAFKKKYKNVFEKKGRLYTKEKINFSAKEFLIKWKVDNTERIKEMYIKNLNLLYSV